MRGTGLAKAASDRHSCAWPKSQAAQLRDRSLARGTRVTEPVFSLPLDRMTPSLTVLVSSSRNFWYSLAQVRRPIAHLHVEVGRGDGAQCQIHWHEIPASREASSFVQSGQLCPGSTHCIRLHSERSPRHPKAGLMHLAQ